MRAIILNAGIGKRLMPLTADDHKCLLNVGEKNILEHQLDCLCKVGVEEVTIVTGAKREKIEKFLSGYETKMKVETIFNPFYEITENIVSLWFARKFLKGKLFILMGDLIFDEKILFSLAESGKFCNLAVHEKSVYDEDDMKVSINNDNIETISKKLSVPSAEYLQISFYNEEGSFLLKKVIDKIIDEQRFYGWYPEAIQKLINLGNEVLAVRCDGLKWFEIDSLENLEVARSGFFSRS